MSVVDNFIAALLSSEGERLHLASGKPAVLTVSGVLEPIPGGPIEREALEDMVRFMGGAIDAGQHEFEYESPMGPVQVTARITERLLQAIIRPAPARETEAEPPASVPVDREPDAAGQPPTGTGSAGPELAARPEPAAGPELATGPEPTADPELDAGSDTAPVPELDAHPEADPAGTAETAPLSETDSPEPFGRTYAFGVSSLDSDGTAASGVSAPADAGGSAVAETDPAVRDPVSGPGGALEVREDAPAMERLFVKMVEQGCSDLHISAGSPPLFRKDGRITDLGTEPRLSATQAQSLLLGITPDKNRKEFEERNDTDFAYEIPTIARFRCNLFRDRNGMGGVFRQIPTAILTAEQLGLPAHLLELCQLRKGLILVTGPTGSGKSTTLAALLDHVNRTREDHVITIEDPIEFVHQNRRCLINQREVGEHTRSFKVALRAALREDPDIVLVGELRDLETVEIALETAETGHLVFGTLHTNTAPGTVSRLIDQFPSGQQAQIRTMLADTLKAVVAQSLCRKIGGGRIAALETLVVTTAVANLIREDKAFQISSAMQTGRAQGMRTLNDALVELVKRKVVAAEEAYIHAVDKPEFLNVLSRGGIELDQESRVA